MTDQPVVLVTGAAVSTEALVPLTELGVCIRRVEDHNLGKDALHEQLAGAVGYIVGGDEKVLHEHIEQAVKLQTIAWLGTDFRANLPGWKRAFELGVAVINTPGANAQSVAELTLSMMLTMTRPYVSGWSKTRPGRELHGLSLGIIGLGNIGARVARIAANGFGMNVCYFAPSRKVATEAELGVEFRERDHLLGSCDIVSLHRNGPMFGEAPELGRVELDLMRSGALVVNTGHVGLIDTFALLEAMQSKGLRAAVDDRVEDNAVWDRLMALGAERFLAGAQMGYYTLEASRRATRQAATAMCAVLSGEPSPFVNNPGFMNVRQARLDL